MKQLVASLIAAIAIGAISCAPNGQERVRKDSNTLPEHDYRIVNIDGCQYIEVNFGVGDGEVYSLTHKGNCDNPIHPEHLRK